LAVLVRNQQKVLTKHDTYRIFVSSFYSTIFMDKQTEIVNKVANSGLVSIDLEQYYPAGKRMLLDISGWLYEGLILREKDFRERVKNNDWQRYNESHVAIICTADAIVPLWAYMLLSSHLQPFATTIVHGDLDKVESILYRNWMDSHNFSQYRGQRLIIKGCSKKPVPTDAFAEFVRRAQPFAKSIMFGEPCSTVPVYKQP